MIFKARKVDMISIFNLLCNVIVITFEPLDGFSNFKKVKFSKFCKEFSKAYSLVPGLLRPWSRGRGLLSPMV